ncbi:Uncharacterized protein TCM_030321 [Theobroma cacao]|uniref:Uncharacterized protein n=1 Tax=Theobroma cacao TaxID=3641 RepID=A0A061GG36_THECC|nr:Uncharacterized protein TCM_030321 [Theobroma cacao]
MDILNSVQFTHSYRLPQNLLSLPLVHQWLILSCIMSLCFGASCNLGVPRSTVLAPTEHIACFISYLFFFPIDTGKPAHVWLLLLTDWFCYYVVVSVMKLEELEF